MANFTVTPFGRLRHFRMGCTVFPGPLQCDQYALAVTRALMASDILVLHEMAPPWERLLEVGTDWAQLYNDDPADLGLYVFDILVRSNVGGSPVMMAVTPLNIDRNGLAPSVTTGVAPNLQWNSRELRDAFTSWAMFLADYQITKGAGGPCRHFYTGIEVNFALPTVSPYFDMIGCCAAAWNAVWASGKALCGAPFSLSLEAQIQHLQNPAGPAVYDVLWAMAHPLGRWYYSVYPNINPAIGTAPVPADYFDLSAAGTPLGVGDLAVVAESGSPTANSESAYNALVGGSDIDALVWFWALDPDFGGQQPAFEQDGLYLWNGNPKAVSPLWQADHLQASYTPREEAEAASAGMPPAPETVRRKPRKPAIRDAYLAREVKAPDMAKLQLHRQPKPPIGRRDNAIPQRGK